MNYTTALAALGVASIALLGCDGKPGGASSQPSVAASYQELAVAFASCGEDFEECDAAAEEDWDALRSCGAQFRSCRDQAGAQAIKAMVVAIHACIGTARDCAKGADASGKTACRRQLGTCLGEQRSGQQADDDDAGEARHGRGSLVRDCIEKLKQSVDRGETAELCARGVRMCVADALPAPEDLDPESVRDDDAGMLDGEQIGDDDARGHGYAAAAARRAARWVAARACLGDFRSCVRSRHAAGECVEMLRECTHPGGR
jgi:hypothetical protein